MNLDYQLKSSDFSLKVISAVEVAIAILKACGRKPVDYFSKELIENEARERVKQLDLPIHASKTVGRLVWQINMDAYDLHFALSGHCVQPVFTQYGTVDLETTTTAILTDTSVDNCIRFILACTFCFERHIFDIGKLLTEAELERIRARGFFAGIFIGRMLCPELGRFWIRIYERGFNEQIHHANLSQQSCNEGFRLALMSANDSSVKYFIDKASLEAIDYVVKHAAPGFSPATYCLLFSKITKNQQRRNVGVMSYLLLQALLRWPYLRFFLRASRLLINHLSVDAYWEIMTNIVHKASGRYKDDDYQELFMEFWELGNVHRRCSPIDRNWHYIMRRVVTFTDNQKLNWLKSKMSAEEREELLLICEAESLC